MIFIFIYLYNISALFGPNDPYFDLILCPFDNQAPTAVSLSWNKTANAENFLKIIDNQPIDGIKKKFGVCVKQVTISDRKSVIRFIEWAETMLLLGAGKIHVSKKFLHPEMLEVEKYYEKQNFIEFIPFTDAKGFDISKLYHFLLLEYLTVNDCILRVKNLYDLVLIIDLDEIFLPAQVEDKNWHEMFKRLNLSSNVDAFAGRSVSYSHLNGTKYSDIPEYLYTLTHVEVSGITRELTRFSKDALW